MKNKKHGLRIFLGVLLGLGLLCLPLSGLAAEKLAIGTVYPADMTNNEVYPALMYFTTLLEKESGGAYEVEIFGGGQLGSEVEVTRECQTGVTVQMSIASSGAFSSFYKKYQAIVGPYLFPDRMTAWGFFDSNFFAGFMGELPAIGLRYLGTMDDGGGFVVLTNNLRPVNTPADFKGVCPFCRFNFNSNVTKSLFVQTISNMTRCEVLAFGTGKGTRVHIKDHGYRGFIHTDSWQRFWILKA